jgi:hypothetical protein
MSSRSGDLTPEAAARLTLDTEPYLSCDDCFDQVDANVERLLAGTDTFPAPFGAHLIGCSACREEAASLAELAAKTAGVDPEAVHRRFDQALMPDDGPPA